MNSQINFLPAVALGGPPHSGKSVLAYSLSQALRRRSVPHYVLRAYPDGEGDWANEADRALVRAIRVKGLGTPEWVARITRDIAARPLPLIVDPGGKPTLWQEAILRECTHGILLCPDDASRQEWRARFNANDLILLADFRSELQGVNRLESDADTLRGALTGLERGHTASGPAFERLVEWLARLFAYSDAELREKNFQSAPTELVLELEQLGPLLNALNADRQWLPSALPRLLDYLPAQQPLAVYGRGPNWLYAALALHAHPRPFYQFDSRLGWVSPPLTRSEPLFATAPFTITPRYEQNCIALTFTAQASYLDYTEMNVMSVPIIPSTSGLILDGKLPLWLWTSLARAYADVLWLAVYQPQRASAIVIHSHTSEMQVGALVPYAAAHGSNA